MNRRTLLIGLGIGLFIITGSWFLHVPVISYDTITAAIVDSGPMAPLAYIAAYTICAIIFIPITPLTAVGGALFGGIIGTVYAIIGGVLGALISFGLARKLGAQTLQKVIRHRHYHTLSRYQTQLDRHGLMTTFILRAVSILPFTLISYGLGLLKIKTKDYVLGTIFGVLPGTIAVGFFAGSLAHLKPVQATIGLALIVLVSISSHWYYHRFHMRRVTIKTTSDDELLTRAATIIGTELKKLLQKKDSVVLALPGGRSMSTLLAKLKNEKVNWQRIHIFMIDERLVGHDDAESNFRLIREGLDGVIPAANLHPFIYYPRQADCGVEAYIDELERVGGEYDMIVASAGEDGHIGGLFPNHSSIAADDPYFITFTDSPKPPGGRMSSSKTLLQTATTAMVLFNGKTKIDAYQNFKSPKIIVDNCPAKLVDYIPRVHILTNFS